MKPINIVFDIDGVLACHKAGNIKDAAFFLKKGAILKAIKTHYIVPGALELLKLLFQMEHVTVSFFSAGVVERNEVFVKKLLTLALGQEEYEKISGNVRIFSRHHLAQGTRNYKDAYGLGHGNYKKDLSVFLKESDQLQNSIMIDDDYSYIAEGQERNLLKLPEVSSYDFIELSEKLDRYNEKGYKKIELILEVADERNPELNQYSKDSIIRSEKIYVHRKDGVYKILYANKNTHLIEEIVIDEKKHPQLVEFLNTSYDQRKSKDWNVVYLDKPTDLEMVNEIHKIVDTAQGKVEKLCNKVNAMFYLTGFLFKAMEIARNTQTPISEVLFQYQYRPGKTEGTYEYMFDNVIQREDLYWAGLEKLQQVNENIAFTTPHEYVKCINSPLTKEEEEFLELTVKEEHSYLGF